MLSLLLHSICAVFRSRTELVIENLALRQQLAVLKATFLGNHRECIAAMDFFTVPTAMFRVLYVLFVIHHARRQVLHFNITAHPASEWVLQQLREAFPYDTAPRYVIFDRDTKFGRPVIAAMKAMEIQPSQTALRSPWQNGVAERWVGSCRRELLDHVVVLGARHLLRLLRD